MTAHAMTLPGRDTHGASGEVRCWGCPIVLGPVIKGDTPEAWHAALQGGIATTKQYLAMYNPLQEKHGINCTFKMLPPSIHVLCREDYKALEAERDLANGVV